MNCRFASTQSAGFALLVFGLSAGLFGGCASDNNDDSVTFPPADGGEGGGGGGSGGTGGEGGTPSVCAQDCSLVATPDCLTAVCNDGSFPGEIGSCVVVPDDGAACDDGQYCTTDDTCSAGTCVGGPTNDCDMTASACNTVVCNEASDSCSEVPAENGVSCVSDNLCETNAKCQAGACVGVPKDCFFSPLNECNTTACNPATGACDGTPDAAKDGLGCDLTGDLCMVAKVCQTGQCVGGTPKDCSAFTQNCVNGVCDPQLGGCMGVPIAAGGDCEAATDGCNQGICDNGGNCLPMALTDGTPCDDFNSCTSTDVCDTGVCGGTVDPVCSLYFEENFETCPPPGWTLASEWECGIPGVGPTTAFQGQRCLGTNIDQNYSNGLTYDAMYAETPPIDLSLADGPVMIFHMWVDTEGSTYDGMNLKISDNNGATFAVHNQVMPVYPLTVNTQPAYGGHQAALGWQTVIADLAAYQGSQIIARFSFRSDGSNVYPGIYVDEVTVVDGAVIPVEIDPLVIPALVPGDMLSEQLTAFGGGTKVWSIVGGSNNAWLSVDANTGLLTGTPAAGDIGPVSIIVRAESAADPNNFDEMTFNFEVGTLIADFDGACPNGWTLTGSWECGAPTGVGPTAALSGLQCLGTDLDANYSSDIAWGTQTATSPVIDLTGLPTPALQFYAWVHTEGNTYDGFNVKVSTNGGATFNLVNTVLPAYTLTVDAQAAWGGNLSAQGYQPYLVDLSAFAGQSILVQYDFRTDSSLTYPGVYIDEVILLE